MLDQSQFIPAANRPDPVPLILDHLASGNDVIRTGAVRAAAALAIDDDRVRVALLSALLDEDPDVRTDAMDALVYCARPEDAETLRRSLLGDPVREVKHAAIRALTRLNDTASIPIIRKLVISRADDEVAWEDDNDAWDDWLDVQIAVIEALGQLGLHDAIEDILAARDDEEGQVLDGPVFAALAAMGDKGVVWLLAVAQTEKGLGRKRALEVLATMQSDVLADFVDVIVSDDLAEVRSLALPLLMPDDPRVEALALQDVDEGVRCETLRQFAAHRPDFAIKALWDKSELVQAAALDNLMFPLESTLQSTLADNAIAWIRFGKEELAIAAARNLPRLASDRACEPLMELVRDAARPLEARLAAANALAELDDVSATERLIILMGNETQQVRAVALTHLAERCRAGDSAAGQALAMAMDGTLLSPDRAVVVHEAETGPDLGMSKTDEAPRGHLRISHDGYIIETDPGDTNDATLSTLEAIQRGQHAEAQPDLAEDTPEESTRKRRHRRAVEGPETIADDLRVLAIRIAGDVPEITIEAAVVEAVESEDDALRLTAYCALLKRAQTDQISTRSADLAAVGLTDENPAIRSTAADILSLTTENSAVLEAYLEDSDALVRAVAVRHAATNERALLALEDPALVVRKAALAKLLAVQQDNFASAVFDALIRAERIDSLADACRNSHLVLNRSIQALTGTDVTPKQAHVLLEALARCGTPTRQFAQGA